MNTRSRQGGLAAVLLSVCALAHGQTQGLLVDPDVWPRWQARASVVLASGLPGSSIAGTAPFWNDDPQRQAPGVGLMGDYYLSGPWLGPRRVGGLRASGGVFIGPRTSRRAGPGAATTTRVGAFSIDRHAGAASSGLLLPRDTALEHQAAPYVGLGYTGLSASGRWGYSADLGLMAGARDGVRLGRSPSVGASLDDAIRDMRWSPMLQFGMSYSF